MTPKEHLKLDISGLELARRYYMEVGRRKIEEAFPQWISQMAIGLVGEGSECFGCDDILSTDHDYGPSFCIWLPDEACRVIREDLQTLYQALPKEFAGSAVRYARKENVGRRGVHEISRFYAKYTGLSYVPKTWQEWIRLPEHYLATATNGEIFEDNLGEFSRIRRELLAFYPEDVRLKKIAARAITMAHTGQCNYARMMCRGDIMAANLALNDFVKETISIVYLLNKVYMPYYKWMWQKMKPLERLSDIADLLEQLITVGTDTKAWENGGWEGYPHGLNSNAESIRLIEQICAMVAEEMRRQGISESNADYLEHHAFDVMKHIKTTEIRGLSVFYG